MPLIARSSNEIPMEILGIGKITDARSDEVVIRVNVKRRAAANGSPTFYHRARKIYSRARAAARLSQATGII